MARLDVEKKRAQLHEIYCRNRRDLRELKQKEAHDLQDRIEEKQKFLEMLDNLIVWLKELDQKTISARKVENKEMRLRKRVGLI